MRGAAVRIVVRELDGRYAVSFSGNLGALDIRSHERANTIQQLRRPYAERMREARRALGSEVQLHDYAPASRFLRSMHVAGNAIQGDIFGKRLPEVVDFMTRSLAVSNAGEPPLPFLPIIEVDDGGLFFPIEIMPMLNASTPNTRLDADWKSAARAFVGMSSAITYVSSEEEREEVNLNHDGLLSLRLFYNAGLLGARKELTSFQNNGLIRLLGHWPEAGMGSRWSAALSRLARLFHNKERTLSLPGPPPSLLIARQLMRERDPSSESTEGSHPDVLHFSCHYSRNAESGEFSFSFCGQNADPLDVKISELKQHIHEMLRVQGLTDPRPRPTPLVFLNACGTGALQPDDFIEVNNVFTLAGSRGVIVTETSMPDEYASVFSTCFYEALTKLAFAENDGRTVGAAMHWTKWETLKTFKNPLGLLYTLRGSSDLLCR